MSKTLTYKQVRGRIDMLELTQTEVARACSVTQPHLWHVINGKRKSASLLQKAWSYMDTVEAERGNGTKQTEK